MSVVDGAVVHEQGVTFGVAAVRAGTLSSSNRRSAALSGFRAAFGGIPTVLMEQDGRGVPTYFGRPDIVRFLSSVDLRRLPWRRMSLSP
jgi:hypothetical protein